MTSNPTRSICIKSVCRTLDLSMNGREDGGSRRHLKSSNEGVTRGRPSALAPAVVLASGLSLLLGCGRSPEANRATAARQVVVYCSIDDVQARPLTQLFQ